MRVMYTYKKIVVYLKRGRENPVILCDYSVNICFYLFRKKNANYNPHI